SEEAMQAYRAMHYPPLGTRGVGLAPAQKYGAAFQEYREWEKDGPVLIVQIEHIQAVRNLKEILSLDEVDGFLVGPYDLSGSLNAPGQFEKSEFLQAMEQIIQASK